MKTTETTETADYLHDPIMVAHLLKIHAITMRNENSPKTARLFEIGAQQLQSMLSALLWAWDSVDVEWQETCTDQGHPDPAYRKHSEYVQKLKSAVATGLSNIEAQFQKDHDDLEKENPEK